MVRLTARFDGRVLVPDQPVVLPTDVPLDVTVRTANGIYATDTLRTVLGLGAEVWGDLDPIEYQRQEREGWS